MPNSALGWINAVKTATLSAAFTEPLLPVTNLVGDLGAPSTAWQTLAGALAPVLTITPPARTTFRAVGAFRTNLSASATMIARLFALQPATIDLEVNFLTNVLDPRITFTRASTGTYFDYTGTMQIAPINTARLDYDPATLLPRGLLIEEARTNIMLNSQMFTGWSPSAASKTQNALAAPDGSLTATKITEDTSATAEHYLNSATISSAVVNAPLTFSCYVKDAGRRYGGIQLFDNTTPANTYFALFDLTLGTLTATALGGAAAAGSASITPVGAGWFRVSLTVTLSATATTGAFARLKMCNVSGGGAVYTGDGVSSLYSWGAQLESGAFPTSYIPTTSGAATRATEIAVMSALGLSGQSLSIMVEAQNLRAISAATDAYVFYSSGAAQLVRTFFRSSGVEPASSIEGTATGSLDQAGSFTGTVFRHGITIQPGTITASVNGVTPVTGTITGTVASSWTNLNFGGDSAGSVPWNGYVRRWRHWSRALTATELRTATDVTDNQLATATVTAVNGQAVAVFSADTPADFCTVSFSDLANPDDHINVPLVFAGPLWFPQTALSWASTMGRDDITDTVTTRGGQVYTNLRATSRRWELALDGVRLNEVFTQLDPLDRYARIGSNVLILPDVTSANLQYEATFGQLKPTADIAYPYSTPNRRSWRARVTERL